MTLTELSKINKLRSKLSAVRDETERKKLYALFLYEQIKLEEYISTIPYSEIRMIVRFRFVDGMTWKQTARRSGIKSEAAKKALYRFLKADN